MSWTPAVGDRVRVVSVAPLEETLRKNPTAHVANWLQLGDEGVARRLSSVDGLFEVRFDARLPTVFCNTEMVQPCA